MLIKLWEQGGNIPVREDNEVIDDDWYIWKKGTPVMDIWHWFDEQLEYIAPQYTLNDLMYHKIKGADHEASTRR